MARRMLATMASMISSTAGGQVVAHVGEHQQPRAGHRLGRGDAAARLAPADRRSPWITSVGAVTRRSPAVRSGLARIAIVWRADAGGVEAALERGRGDRWRASSSSKCGPEISRTVSTLAVDRLPRACGPSSLRQPAQQLTADPAVRAVAGVRHDRRQAGTRRGWPIAIAWAIIPPIDAPTTWAASMPRWSSSPAASSAMSLTCTPAWRACRETRRGDRAAHGGRGASIFVDRPMSRLSKRITRKPALDRALDEVHRPGDRAGRRAP